MSSLKGEIQIAVQAALREHLPPCSYDPEPLIGVPLGMHHCPNCGTMVVAGIPHGPVDVEAWCGTKIYDAVLAEKERCAQIAEADTEYGIADKIRGRDERES